MWFLSCTYTHYLNHHDHQPISKFQLTAQEPSSNPQGDVVTMAPFLTMLAVVAMVDTLHYHSNTFIRGVIFSAEAEAQKVPGYLSLDSLHNFPPAVLFPHLSGSSSGGDYSKGRDWPNCPLLCVCAPPPPRPDTPTLHPPTVHLWIDWALKTKIWMILKTGFQQNWIHRQEKWLLSQSILNLVLIMMITIDW